MNNLNKCLNGEKILRHNFVSTYCAKLSEIVLIVYSMGVLGLLWSCSLK